MWEIKITFQYLCTEKFLTQNQKFLIKNLSKNKKKFESKISLVPKKI